MKALVLAGLAAALVSQSPAFAQGGAGASRTGSSIDSSSTGGATGAGASSLNTSSDNNGGGSNATAKSSTMRPGDNDTRQSQGGQMAVPGTGTSGTNRK
jgi:transcription elongation factor